MVVQEAHIVEQMIQANDDFIKKIDLLSKSIERLQYEGKRHQRRNLRQAKFLIEYLYRNLYLHMSTEEKYIFPFADRHIPKLEAVTGFLRGENVELRSIIKKITLSVEKISQIKYSKTHQKILSQVIHDMTYFVCLVRNHIRMENEGLYRVLAGQLKRSELNLLNHSICGHSA